MSFSIPEPSFPEREEWFIVFWDWDSYEWRGYSVANSSYQKVKACLVAQRIIDPGKEWRLVKVTRSYNAYKPRTTPNGPHRGTHATPVPPEAV